MRVLRGHMIGLLLSRDLCLYRSVLWFLMMLPWACCFHLCFSFIVDSLHFFHLHLPSRFQPPLNHIRSCTRSYTHGLHNQSCDQMGMDGPRLLFSHIVVLENIVGDNLCYIHRVVLEDTIKGYNGSPSHL